MCMGRKERKMQFVIPIVQIALILFKVLGIVSLTWLQVFIPTIIWLVLVAIQVILAAIEKS